MSEDVLVALEVENIIKDAKDKLEANSYRPLSMEGLEIKIFENYVSTKIGEIEKAISLEDFRVVFETMFENKVTNVSVTSLPFGCFAFGQSFNKTQISCYYPGEIRTIQYKTRTNSIKKFKIPFPNIIISHELELRDKLWNVLKTNYLITKKSVAQIKDCTAIMSKDLANGIAILPFSNIYEHGGMCYGNNTMPIKFTNNLRGLDYYFQVLTIAPFNDDLGIRGLTASSSVENWYKELSELKEFPYNRIKDI